MPPSVTLRGVSKVYRGGFEAVHDVSLEIRQGEFFAILGPSGSGKSTTLRMIGGFERVTEGTVLIDGVDMADRPPFQRNVNTVFQSYALFPHLDVFENVGFGLRMARVPRKERAARVVSALAAVQLSHLERRRTTELSGGEQQRVALARALVNHPRVLLLDEPLGALDLKLRQEMQLELKRIQQEVGITFLHVTHDQDEAMALADRIAIMHDGQLAQIGPPAEIYDQPRSRFVAEFIGRVNLLQGQPTGIQDGVVTVQVGGLGEVLATGGTLDGSVQSAGRDVTVAVRPERVQLTHAGNSLPDFAVNRFPGEVVRSAYGATDVMYEVQLSGRTVEIAVPKGEGSRSVELEPGALVTVGWSIAAGIVVESGPDAAIAPG